MEMGIIRKILVSCCAIYLVLFIFTVAGHLFYGIPFELFPEEEATHHEEYYDLDLNGDGGLSFDELRNYDYNTSVYLSESLLKGIFEDCDKNNNSLLKGREMDHYFLRVNDEIKALEKEEEKARNEAAQKAKSQSSSSSSSSSNHKYVYGEDGLCIYCGSDEYSRSRDGMGNFECDSCGSYLYWHDLIDIDDLRCPKCGGHVYSDDYGNSYKCKKCGKSFNFGKLDVA